MIRSEKKILILEIFLPIFLFTSIFFKSIINDYFIIILLLITIALMYLIAGYEKDSKINGDDRRKLLQYVSFYCIGFIIFEYGLGLLTGYSVSPYKTDLLNILLNVFPTFLIIILSELLRYMIVKKGERNKLILCLVIPLFVLIDLALNIRYWDLSVNKDLLEFTTNIFLTSFFKNIMLTTFTYKYGMKPSIVYRLILELYIYI